MKYLYIFVTTDRPDQYLNSIVHCIEQGTKNIVFIQVEDNKSEQIQLNLLQTNVYNLLQNISTGIYKYYTGSLKDTIINLDTEYNADEIAKMKVRYNLGLTDSISWKIERIAYLNLRKYIYSISRKTKDIFIDVTSVSKVYIGDIFTCCLLENIDSIYNFELLIKPNFDKAWKTLIHELDKGKYRYTNLTETLICKEGIKAILVRTMPLRLSIVGTIIFVALILAATLILGFNSAFVQIMSTLGTVLGIISFFLIYFPVRGK